MTAAVLAMPPDPEDAEAPPPPPPEPVKHRRGLRYLIVIASLVLVIAAIGGIKGAQIAKLIGFGEHAKAAGPPPEAVSSAVAQANTWESSLAAVGSVSGVKNVAVSNDAPGLVVRLGFESGDVVKRGEILVELDARPERAQLASARARRASADLTARRSRVLVAKDALAQQQLDLDETALQTASADVGAIQAQLDRKIVRAPFPGKLGIRAVNLGQYLAPGTAITTLDSIDGTFVDFTLPQEQLGVIESGMAVRITVRGAQRPLQGAINAVDPTVDAASRNVKIRARVDDPDSILRPGMFVTVAVVLPKPAQVVAVPATAIVHASYGDSLFVIEDKKPGSPGMTGTPDGQPVKVARQQFVRVGQTRGDFVAIARGLKPGQTVVAAGAFKLRNGAPVVINNKIAPAAELEPHPENR